MGKTLVPIIAFIIVAAGFALWPRPERIIETHFQNRQFVTRLTLARTDNPVVILGDSIVEASTLPRSVCDHPIVNAGVSGATTGSNLGQMLTNALDGKRASLVVVSLGTNDAAERRSETEFSGSYRALLRQVSAQSRQVAALAVPPIEGETDRSASIKGAIDSYNSVLPGIAKDTGATFIKLPAMPSRHTVDGVHLNADGYDVWNKAVLKGIEAMLCSSR